MKQILSLACAGLSAWCALGTTPPLSAQALKPAYDIAVGGVRKNLEVSTAEVAIKQSDGRRMIAKVTNADPGAEAKAVRARNAPATEVEIVLVPGDKGPKAAPKAAAMRHFVTREILVKVKPGWTAKAVAQIAGLRISREPSYAPGYVILDALTSEGALAAMESLRAMPEVESADVLLATQKEKKWIPNDTYFAEQWHHQNTTQLGGALWVDTGITSAWDSVKGSGITIGILDDGLQHTHPDLQPNYNTAIDYDFNSADDDPTPVDLTNDAHGTSCAGVSAACGNNGLGVCGAAPEATLAGFRLIAAANTDQDEADAFSIHNDVIQVKSNSWGQPDGTGYGGMGPLAAAALEAGVTSGRGGKGVIYVFAGGNGLDLADNSNFDGYSASPYVIAVAAVNDFGFQSWYSEPGANLLIAAPSAGGAHNDGIRTTDITGEGGGNTSSSTGELSNRDYTNDFGGTSSACPLVSGIVALILQANPDLGWRDVQEILIRTARKCHRTDPDWATNAAGFSFNHKYGAGLIDAGAAVALAQQWTNLPVMTTMVSAQTGLSVAISDNNPTGVTRSFSLADGGFRIEHVTVTVNATHTARGDLEVILTSPSGMVSKLAQKYIDGTDNLAWTFGSVRHWGESLGGTWKVKVADRAAGDAGTLTGVTIKFWGSNRPGNLFNRVLIAGASATLSAEGNTPANSAADPGEAVSFSLGLRNIGLVATTSLTATLLPIGGVRDASAAQSYGALAAGGPTMSRTFSFRADGACGMSLPAILHLQDGATDLGFVNLNIPLCTSTSSTFTGGGVTIPTVGAGSPSPSNLTVSGLVGRVQNFTAQLVGLTHTYVDDAGALLHGPDALKIRLFCGGIQGTTSGSKDFTFDDDAAEIFPAGGSLLTGSYRSWDYYGADRSFTGDPAAELAYTLGEFRGVPPNGTWKLYVQDFSSGDSGSISSWKLNFTTVTCTDNVFLTQAATTCSESVGSVTVSVTRTGGMEESATVDYATSNGSALADADYSATFGTLTFAPGERVKSFSVPISDDASEEPEETIHLTLSAAGGNATLGTLFSGTLTIQDNDTPTPVTLSPSVHTLAESAVAVTFSVSRFAAGSPGAVTFATGNGTAAAGVDYVAASGTLDFSSSELTKSFTVDILNDSVFESDETFSVALSSATGGLVLGSPATATVTLVDGDSDGDTMADDYETMVGLSPGSNDAGLDLAGDGLSNLDEFVLGSLPNSGASQFLVTPEVSGSDYTLAFTSVPGRIYAVEWSADLQPPWTPVQTGIAGTGVPVTVTDPGAALQFKRFYRVVVGKP